MISQLIDPSIALNLFDDLRRIQTEPCDAMWANAPVLDFWTIVATPAFGLRGTVHGHPHLKDGHQINTSQVFYIDSAPDIARTYSRWYRLNRLAGSISH